MGNEDLTARVERLETVGQAFAAQLRDFPLQHGRSDGGHHFRHIAENLTNGIRFCAESAKEQLFFGRIQNATHLIELAEKDHVALTEYFRLLETYPAYLGAELREPYGMFSDIRTIDRKSEDFHCFYVAESAKRLSLNQRGDPTK